MRLLCFHDFQSLTINICSTVPAYVPTYQQMFYSDGKLFGCEMWREMTKSKCSRDKTLLLQKNKQTKHKSRAQKPAAMDSWFGLVKPHRMAQQADDFWIPT